MNVYPADSSLSARVPSCSDNRALGIAVHGIDEIDLRDAVVVLGLHFRVDLVDRQHLLIAARFRELNRRRTIGSTSIV